MTADAPVGLLQKALRLRWELGLENQPMAGILQEANATMGIEPLGTLVQQADSLLEVMGIPLTEVNIPRPKPSAPPAPPAPPAPAADSHGEDAAPPPAEPQVRELPAHMRPPPPRAAPAYSTMASRPTASAASRGMAVPPRRPHAQGERLSNVSNASEDADEAEAAEELLERLERRAAGGQGERASNDGEEGAGDSGAWMLAAKRKKKKTPPPSFLAADSEEAYAAESAAAYERYAAERAARFPGGLRGEREVLRPSWASDEEVAAAMVLQAHVRAAMLADPHGRFSRASRGLPGVLQPRSLEERLGGGGWRGAASASAAPQDVRHKTRLCHHWQMRGACSNGSRCNFAHGADELSTGKAFPSNFTEREQYAPPPPPLPRLATRLLHVSLRATRVPPDSVAAAFLLHAAATPPPCGRHAAAAMLLPCCCHAAAMLLPPRTPWPRAAADADARLSPHLIASDCLCLLDCF